MVESAVSGERAALPPPGPPSRQIGRPSDQNRAALQPKVGGHPLKSGGPIPPRLGGRAALRAATLKLRAARMWPPLGRWAAHGGRGGRPCGSRAATLKMRAALTEKGPPLGPPFEKGAARRAARRAARPARAALRAAPQDKWRPEGPPGPGRRAARVGPEGGPQGRPRALTTL